ncbi:MAG: glycosyltransferase family 4 protein [Chloroflexi bacterium]|nr:glycosyltransferase family 4 protein [Chloroflexota bacterium]
MRILIDARTIQDHFPGIGRYVYNLIDALAPQVDGELLLLVHERVKNTRYSLSPLARHANIQLIPTAIPVFHWQEQGALPRLIRRLHPQLVHFPYNVRPFWLGLPSMLTLYDAIPRRFPQYFGRLRRWQIEIVQRLAIRRSDAFVAISQTTAHDFTTYYHIPARRITVTPLAPDPIFRPQPPPMVAGLRQRLDLPESYILYLGSNKPHKNLPRLIAAYAQLRQQRSSAPPLLIAGHWDERYPVARRQVATQKLGHCVHFLGPIRNVDLPALYAGAMIFVFPSLYEGVGLPVLEAMACGAAVVCSNTSSLPEVAGDAALLFDPTDTAAMSAAMLRLLQDEGLRRDCGQRGVRQAAGFRWSHTAAATLAGYRRLLEDQG